MSHKIDGFNGLPASTAAAGTPAARPGAGKDPVAPAPAAAAVKLSTDAVQLQELEVALRAAPEVNEARVAAIREALADGSYKIDAQRIAARLLALERDLPK